MTQRFCVTPGKKLSRIYFDIGCSCERGGTKCRDVVVGASLAVVEAKARDLGWRQMSQGRWHCPLHIGR
jgi:hypothetical protein